MTLEASIQTVLTDRLDDRLVLRGITDNTTLAHFTFADFELRLHKCEDDSTRVQQVDCCWEHEPQRDE